MIITRMIGGLGNQLFQYAIGRHLAQLNQTELYVDTNEYVKYKLYDYELNHFNVMFYDSNKINKNSFITKYYDIKTKYCIQKLLYNKYILIKENKYCFDNKIIKIYNKDVYLSGYWQSEKYFLPIRNILINEITLKNKLSVTSREIEKRIYDSPSISIHIRRGDYISNPKTNSFHGVCDFCYYNNAIELLSQIEHKPIFFVFSDDILWAKEYMKIRYDHVFIEKINGRSNIEDFWLMSKCKHNIIANSSFSWWAAWLNQNKNKTIIAPQKWFTDPKINTHDLIPQSWITI